MIRRLFWLGLGVAVGALVVRKLSRMAASASPAGVAEGVNRTIADFAASVRSGMSERETELRSALGVDPHAAQASTAPSGERFGRWDT